MWRHFTSNGMGTSHTSPDQIKFDYPIRNFLSNFGTKKVAFHDFKEQTELLKSVERRNESRNPIHVSITTDETEIYFW